MREAAGSSFPYNDGKTRYEYIGREDGTISSEPWTPESAAKRLEMEHKRRDQEHFQRLEVAKFVVDSVCRVGSGLGNFIERMASLENQFDLSVLEKHPDFAMKYLEVGRDLAQFYIAARSKSGDTSARIIWGAGKLIDRWTNGRNARLLVARIADYRSLKTKLEFEELQAKRGDAQAI
jgi:hypothetical protein